MASITVETIVNKPVEKVWELWTLPRHIIAWNSASEDWHTTFAENDLRVGGSFTSHMAAKDGSFGFDFGGTYNEVALYQKITYTLGDGRKVTIDFSMHDSWTRITETFDAETENTIERQRFGWQAILDHFKQYAEHSEQ